MYRVLIFFSILQLTHCSCPDGFDLVSAGQCRTYIGLKNVDISQIRQTMRDECRQWDALPVIIRNKEDDDYWRARVDNSYLALGIEWVVQERYEWFDGSQIDYIPADIKSAELFKPPNHEKICYFSTYSGNWKQTCGKSGKGNYILGYGCIKQLPPRPLSDDKECNGFFADSGDGVCYEIFTTSEDYDGAIAKCRESGATLASIHNFQENEFVRKLAISRGAVNGLFLGAASYSSSKQLDFQWNDATLFNYTYWQPGLPVTSLGYCLGMDTFSSSGRWINTNCDSKMPFVCARKLGQSPSCPSGPWKEGYIITSPGFPFDASTPCDYVFSVAKGKRVQVEIHILEANTCCDRLVLLDNIMGGNVVATLTGELGNKVYTTESSNIMRVSWQPNGGVNVRGLQMSFRAV